MTDCDPPVGDLLSERMFAQAAIDRAGEAIAIATRLIVIGQKVLRDTRLTPAEMEARNSAFVWACERGIYD